MVGGNFQRDGIIEWAQTAKQIQTNKKEELKIYLKRALEHFV